MMAELVELHTRRLALTLGARRFVARCDFRNLSSLRVMEKLGMRPAGRGVRVYPDARG